MCFLDEDMIAQRTPDEEKLSPVELDHSLSKRRAAGSSSQSSSVKDNAAAENGGETLEPHVRSETVVSRKSSLGLEESGKDAVRIDDSCMVRLPTMFPPTFKRAELRGSLIAREILDITFNTSSHH